MEELLRNEIIQKIEEEVDKEHKKLETIPQEEDIQKEWDQIEKVMKKSLQENVGPRRSKENWFREKCKKVLEERKKMRDGKEEDRNKYAGEKKEIM
jgi:hypothetical protein